MDYFLIYKCILEVIRDERIQDAYQLFDFLSYKEELFQMRETFSKQLMVDGTLEVLDNLIDDGLVVAKRYPTFDGTLYQIERLSTTGHTYLLALENSDTKAKAKEFLKSEGLPFTPSSITKAIARLLW